jgi:hypothetical protein
VPERARPRNRPAPDPDGSEGPLGWAWGALTVLSLVVVALVPGAAMAAGAITVAASAYCSFGSFCLYSGPNFTGRKVEFAGDRTFCEHNQPALDVRSVLPGGARSVVNNTHGATTGLRIKIYSAKTHLVRTTVRPGSEVAELGGPVARAMNRLCVYPRGAS